MKKTLKILLIVYISIAIIFLIGYGIMEVLKVIPFSNNPTFDLIWHIFFGGMHITGAPLVITFIVCFIKFLIQKLKK